MQQFRGKKSSQRDLVVPTLRCTYIKEPLLEFAEGGQHVDPKLGILRYGPKTLADGNRHPKLVRVGLIGTAGSIEAAQQWLQKCSTGFPGDAKHEEFPGFMQDRGFFSELAFDPQWVSQISQTEIGELRNLHRKRDRFDQLLKLIDSKLAVLAGKDLPPQYIVLCIPTDLHADWEELSILRTPRWATFTGTSIGSSRRSRCDIEFPRRFSKKELLLAKMRIIIRKLRGTSSPVFTSRRAAFLGARLASRRTVAI